MRTKKVKIPIYGGTLVIVQSNDMQPVVDKYNLTNDALNCNALAFKQPMKGDKFVVCAAFKFIDPDIIAHEAVHVVNYIFDYKCIQLDLINDEPQAYLTGWVFDECYKFLNKK